MYFTEGNIRRWKSGPEEEMKAYLLEILRKEGRRTFAAILERMDINLIMGDPELKRCVAAICIPDMTVYFNYVLYTYYKLTKERKVDLDSSTGAGGYSPAEVLSVLVRHELMHYLLGHELRLLQKLHLSPEKEAKYTRSSAIHGLYNIIEDFEISNTHYTDQDKELVQNLRVNGQLISGLVTEVAAPGWETLNLEQMEDKLEESAANYQQKLQKLLQKSPAESEPAPEIVTDPLTGGNMYKDYIEGNIWATRQVYQDTDGESALDKAPVINNPQIPAEFKPGLEKIEAGFKTNSPSDTHIKQLLTNIAKSGVFSSVDITDSTGRVLTTVDYPEEKAFTQEFLKQYRDLFQLWYENIMRVVGEKDTPTKQYNWTAEEIKAMYDAVTAATAVTEEKQLGKMRRKGALR